MNAADVTIIVLIWNRRDDTLACLESLAQANLGAAVMSSTNGSRDGSAAAVRERFPAVRVLALPENAACRRQQCRHPRGARGGAQAVVLLNNDTRVSPDFLPPLLWALDAYRSSAR
jgi:GT2 family glycosyltransferase